jgi:hypothetical protein
MEILPTLERYVAPAVTAGPVRMGIRDCERTEDDSMGVVFQTLL